LLDYLIAENKPDAPLFYAPGWTVAANQTPSAPATPSSSTPSNPVAVGYSFDGKIVYASGGQYYTNVNGAWVAYTSAISATPPPGMVVPGQTPGITPLPLPIQPPTSGTVPGTTVIPTATQPQVDVSALVSTLMQQGANQQQAFAAAMQSLQAQGVTPTPQVQQAVANQVQSAGGGASLANLPTWALIGIPLALGTAIFFGRPHRK
jgi:hypothetical protein